MIPALAEDTWVDGRDKLKNPHTASSDAMSTATPATELVVLDDLERPTTAPTSRSSKSSLSATDAKA
jgi:hypothetical protein